MGVVCNIIIYLTFIFSLYYLIMSIFAFKKNKIKKNDEKINYFSILIAARNEEKVIKELIKSLQNQIYDKNYYEINVIINNCTDNTAEIARKSGANVINCETPISCKGEALRYAFNKLKECNNIDAYLVFDADNVVHPDFLREMNYSLNNGFKVAQGTRETKNLNQSWISSSYAIYYYLQNFLISKARKNIGLSTTINGTGFMIKKELIDQIGFNTKTLTEDIEFSAICTLNGVKIDYVEDAITYDEQASNFRDSWNQRMRWTNGTLQCGRLYSLKMLKNFFKNFSLTNIDILFLYMAPIVQILSFIALIINLILILLDTNLTKFIEVYIIPSGISLLISYLFIVIASAYVVIYNKHKLKDAILGILLFSIFVFTWLPISIVSLFKRKINWKPINHERSISINEVMKK